MSSLPGLRPCEWRLHLLGQQTKVVQIGEVKDLEIDTLGSGISVGGDLVEDLSRRAGESVLAQLLNVSADGGRSPGYFGVGGAATGDQSDRVDHRRRVAIPFFTGPPHRIVGVAHGR